MSHPYRTVDGPSAGSSRATSTELEAALRTTTVVVLVWSLLRVAIISLRGLDFEGFLALAVVVAALQSLTSRSRFS